MDTAKLHGKLIAFSGMDEQQSKGLLSQPDSCEDDTQESEKNVDSKPSITLREVFLVLLVGAALLLWGGIHGLIGPFYPILADKKGAKPSQVCNFKFQLSHFLLPMGPSI